jgi:hypothetical protein
MFIVCAIKKDKNDNKYMFRRLKLTQNNKSKNLQQDFFATLSTDTLLEIFSHIHPNKLRQLTRINKQFYDLFHEYFLQTTFGQSLRFRRWHRIHANTFFHEADKFTQDHQGSFLTHPQLTLTQKRNLYLAYGIAFGTFSTIYFRFICLEFLIRHNDIKLADAVVISSAIFSVIITTILVILHRITHNLSLEHLSQVITLEDLTALRNFLQAHAPFLQATENSENIENLIASLQVNVSTRQQMLDVLEDLTHNVFTNAKHLNTYLATLRFSRKTSFAENELSVYGKNMLVLWKQKTDKSGANAKHSLHTENHNASGTKLNR